MTKKFRVTITGRVNPASATRMTLVRIVHAHDRAEASATARAAVKEKFKDFELYMVETEDV